MKLKRINLKKFNLKNIFIGKAGITRKLFIITTLMFAVFILGTLIIQSLFFERLYVSKKKGDLHEYVEKFKADYNKSASEEQALQIIDEYELTYNMKILILDKNYILKGGTQISSKSRNDGFKVRELTDFVRQLTTQYDNQQVLSLGNSNKIYLINNKQAGTKAIVGISSNIQKQEIIFASSSLQPVNEALSVIEKIYLYFSIGAILFTILLAFIYSKMIAKPLLKINKVATKMAQLDFTEKCDVESDDEIGNVAASLNFLSENLHDALTSLRGANEQLEKDIEKERNLEKMRKEFVASVSHELKTPISLIDGYAVGLKDEIFEDADKDYYLDIIIDESKKMSNLVSDMLDLSHLESGLFKLSKEEFNITELINFTLRKYKGNMEERNIKLETSLIDDILVDADWDRMEQVLTNFITNAIKNVEDNGTIYVNMIEENGFISIEVENTGSSIPEDDLPKVWDKFYKLDKSRNRKLGGTGIGLSIVKNILNLHGYAFGALNTEIGVKFYFRIPKYLQ